MRNNQTFEPLLLEATLSGTWLTRRGGNLMPNRGLANFC